MKCFCHNFIMIVLGVALGLILALALSKCKGQTTEPIEIQIHDTITINKERIVEHTKYITTTKYDTIFFSDTIKEDNGVVINDTGVYIPINKYQYQDTITTDTSNVVLNIGFSGYNAKIDTIGVIAHYDIKRDVERKKDKWGWQISVGPYVGYGVGFNGRAVAEVGIGVNIGFGYRF